MYEVLLCEVRSHDRGRMLEALGCGVGEGAVQDRPGLVLGRVFQAANEDRKRNRLERVRTRIDVCVALGCTRRVLLGSACLLAAVCTCSRPRLAVHPLLLFRICLSVAGAEDRRASFACGLRALSSSGVVEPWRPCAPVSA